jgi:GT2 family glycosyltransferase
MIDILYLTHGRLEFTIASMNSLIKQTDWSKVDRLIWYDDDSDDGTREYFHEICVDIPCGEIQFRPGVYGSPVKIMNDYIQRNDGSEVFAKIDNDVILPPYWLTECLTVMRRYPEIDLLGIEAFDVAVGGRLLHRGWKPAQHIGGIGLMKRSAFDYGLPQPEGQRHGFTQWQEEMGILNKAWLVPSLPVLLLDLMPTEPWASLSKKYIRDGFQRAWPPYDQKHTLWPWVFKGVEEHAGECAIRSTTKT